nr:MAG TPA: hypothetical protein [Caudoviricetes sp.]
MPLTILPVSRHKKQVKTQPFLLHFDPYYSYFP